MLSVQHGLELLCDNNRLPNQLLLSSEIGSFEDQLLQKSQKYRIFYGYSLEILTVNTKDFVVFVIFAGLIFKWTYLGAQEELVGQTVVAA